MATFLAVLRWIRANLKIILWVLLSIGAAILFGWLAFRRRPSSSDPATPIEIPPTFQDRAREQIEMATTEAHIEAEIAKAKSAEQRQQLEEIKKVPDPPARREALANWLDSNL